MARPARFTCEVKGLDAIARRLRDRAGKVQRAVGGELYRQATLILNESIPLVPVDTGALRSTGHVDLPVYTPYGVTVRLGYGGVAKQSFDTGGKGGPSTPFVGYAVYVHEVDMPHKVGQWKYLETPFRAAKPAVRAAVRTAASGAMREP